MGERSKGFRIFRTIRILVLGIVAFGAFALKRLNDSEDPRFYQFLNTGPGQTLSRMMGWGDRGGKSSSPRIFKEPLILTKEERAVKQQLERVLQEQTAVDQVIKTNGKVIEGRITDEDETSVKVFCSFGDSGEMSIRVSHDKIQSILRASKDVPEVSYRDVRYKMEFPELNLYRRPPYTVMTSQRYFEVEYATRALNELHEEFIEYFEPLMTTPERGSGIQLLFFSEETEFNAYRKEHAPGLDYSVGFYSPRIDRFVIYDQRSSKQMKNLENQLSSMKQKYNRQYRSQEGQAAVDKWHRNESRRIKRSADQETDRTLRHEGAHQLFHTYGVHSEHHAETLWLVEGLAVFCENRRIGYKPDYYFELLKNAQKENRHVPFSKLVNFRGTGGFKGLTGAEDEVTLGYAQSWLVVDYLMGPQRRDQFYAYIDFVRDPDNTGALAKKKRFALLSECLEMPEAALEKRLMDAMGRL